MNAPERPAPLPDVCGAPLPHESAAAHVCGAADYTDDIAELKGTLYASPVMSPVAHGRLRGLDATAAQDAPGFVALVTAADIPGEPVFAAFTHDEPILPADEVQYLGQVIGLVVARSVREARAAARLVQPDLEPLPAILDIETALQAGSEVAPAVHLQRGDAARALEAAPHTLHGAFSAGGQEHFYLEGQIAYAVPGEQQGWTVYSSTQYPGEVQHWVARALGLRSHQVRVECRRMGGGFGGKETQAGHVAVWAALAARKTSRPVKLRLERIEDFLVTGKRHPFAYRYSVGFDDSGRILGLRLEMASNCGFSADLSGPVNDRAVFHVDNAYFLENVEIRSHRCRTHLQSHTAFRGFGGPQGMLAIERIVSDVARRLGLDPLQVRQRNFYRPGRDTTHYGMRVEDNIAPELVARLATDCAYARRRAAIEDWNAHSPVLKRGLALTPVKFGISFTATSFNQAGALVHVYEDGTVQVNHGGTEMGQGLHTKVCQLVADELGLPFERVRITATATDKVPNASATAASSGTDLNGRAAQFAARQVRERLARFVAEREGCAPEAVGFAQGCVMTPNGVQSFAEVVHAAYLARIQLWSDGFYATPKIHYDRHTLSGRPFYYFAYGAACTEVAIDTLTGESRVLGIDILHDVGRSINPAIDIGQIEGGFVQGMGWLTSEELVWDATGRLTTQAPSTYKIPTARDVPEHFQVALWPEPNRESNVHGSKAVGEPPFMLAIAVFEALREAVAAVNPARHDPVQMNAPATPEQVLRAVQQRRRQEPS